VLISYIDFTASDTTFGSAFGLISSYGYVSKDDGSIVASLA